MVLKGYFYIFTQELYNTVVIVEKLLKSRQKKKGKPRLRLAYTKQRIRKKLKKKIKIILRVR